MSFEPVLPRQQMAHTTFPASHTLTSTSLQAIKKRLHQPVL